MSALTTNNGAGLIRCKGITKSTGEQCRHQQREAVYCWKHEDQEDLPFNHCTGDLDIGRTTAATVSRARGRSSLIILIALIFIFRGIYRSSSFNTIPNYLSLFPPSNSIPEYLGPMSVCNNSEPSLDDFLAWPNASKAKQIPPLYEPATLVDHFINITNSTLGAGTRDLSSLEMSGLAQWQRCDDTSAGGTDGFDLQCVFDAFNALFFEGRLAPVKVRWGSPMEMTGFDGTKNLGTTVGHAVYQGRVAILISHRTMRYWEWSDAPHIYGVILHEMVHAYFALYACIEAYDQRIDAAPSAWSRLIPFFRNLGQTGHGPEWLRMFLALEQVASHHLGLGDLELGWKNDVETEVAAVKTFREKVAKLYRSEVSKIDTEFSPGLSELNALVGLQGVAPLHSFLDESVI